MSLGFSLRNLPYLATSSGTLAVEDDFQRANGIVNKVGDTYSPASLITDGRAAWDVLTGNFYVYDNYLRAGASSGTVVPSTPAIACIDVFSDNVEISADIYEFGGDGIYFRVQDANNWSRVYLKDDVVQTSASSGYYEYEWSSSASAANYVSIYKDPKRYFPSQTSCLNSAHDHKVLVTTPNPQIDEFDPATLKWGAYPYMMVKRGIRYRDGDQIIQSTGNDVRYLQGVLRHHYNDAQMIIDGIFGPYTEARLKQLQRDFKIIADGFAWNLQSWLVVDRLAIAAIEMGTSVEAERTLYLQRYHLGNAYSYPDKTVWSTDPNQPPPTAYREFTHTHDLILDGCRKKSSVGAHTHYVTNQLTGASVFVVTDVQETITSDLKIAFEQCVNGVVTSIPATVPTSWTGTDIRTECPAASHLKVVVYDSYVTVTVNEQNDGWESPQLVTWSAPSNGATKHGVGRGPTNTDLVEVVSRIDNYRCVPIDAMIIPSEVT